MQVQSKSNYYTPGEYLALEEQAEYKSEYHDGEIISMTTETTNHNEITGNIAANLKFGLNKKPYKVYMANVRLWIPRNRLYTYPDVMVIKNKPIYADKGTTTVTNPILIIEVLSKSTQNYDQGAKFNYYRSIPEMQEYILVSQSNFNVMQYSKTKDRKWLLSEYDNQEVVIEFSSIDFKIELSEIYTGVDFSEVE